MSPTKPSRMVGYIRVSRVGTRDVESESYITEAVQREKIEAWARLRDVRIIWAPTDRDQSGSRLDRPGFEWAMTKIAAGEADGIVVAAIDRLSRADVADALMIVRQIMDDHKGTVAAVDLGIDPTTEVGEMLLTVLLALARMQWRRYQAAWETAKTRAIQRGAHVGPTPLGYVRGEDARLVPDPKTAPVVQDGFRIAAAKGLHAATEHFRSSRATRSFRHPRRGNGTHERYWDAQAVKRIVANRVYLGEIRYGKAPPNTEAHEPLVDLATWTKANWRLAEGSVRVSAPASYPLSGVVRCASCGDPMSGNRLGSGQLAYRCRRNHHQHTRRGDQPACEAPAIALARPLEEYVQAALLEHVARHRPDDDVVVVEGADGRDVERAEAALRAAELRRDQDLHNLNLAPAFLSARMAAHEQAIEEAKRAYDEAVMAARPEVRWPLVDEVAAATREQLPELLERCGLIVKLKRALAKGRSDFPERVTLESKEE